MPPPSGNAKVQFGSTVTILRDDGRRQTFRIVGEDEAEPSQGTLSYVSPVARALMNKTVGDVIVAGSGEAEIVAMARRHRRPQCGSANPECYRHGRRGDRWPQGLPGPRDASGRSRSSQDCDRSAMQVASRMHRSTNCRRRAIRTPAGRGARLTAPASALGPESGRAWMVQRRSGAAGACLATGVGTAHHPGANVACERAHLHIPKSTIHGRSDCPSSRGVCKVAPFSAGIPANGS